MKEIKVPGYTLSYGFDRKNNADKYLLRFFSRLTARVKTHSPESLAREDILTIANIPVTQSQPYHIKGNSKIALNVSAEHAERAKIFFDTLNGEAYKLTRDDNEPSHDRMRQLLKNIAQKSEDKYQRIIQKRIEQEAIAKQKDTTSFPIKVERRRLPENSKAVLEIMTTQTARDWFIDKFNIADLTHEDKVNLENQHGIKNATIFDINMPKMTMYFSCSDLDADLAKIFLQKLEGEVKTAQFQTADWNNVFDKIYDESVLTYQQVHSTKMQTLETKKKKSSSKPGNILIDWTPVLDEPVGGKEHFAIDTNRETKGHHNVLIAKTRHAQCVYNALQENGFAENFELYFGDPSFSIKPDSLKRPTFRISSKIEFSDAKFNALKNILNGMIHSNHASEFSREKIRSDIKKSISSIEEEVQQRQENQKNLVKEAEVKRERDNNFTVKHSKENKAFFVHLSETLGNSKKTRLDNLKNLFKLDYVTKTSQGIRIGSKSAQELSDKQEEFKGFVLWLADQKSPDIQKEVTAGRFVKPLEKYRAEKSEELQKKREKSYQQISIPETLHPIQMLDSEQVQVNQYLHEKDFIMLLGEAGTGKTFLAVALACYMLLNDSYPIKQVIITRPKVTTGSKEEGFLPGDVKDKMGPYLDGYKDNLNQIFKGREHLVDELMNERVDKGENGREIKVPAKIVVQDISYIRGRTLPNTIVIVDECQDLTPPELAVIPRRLGTDSKLIMAGDITDNQTDLPEAFKHTFKNFAMEIAMEINENEIVSNGQGTNALDMYGLVQLTTVRRSPFVNNVIAVDKHISRKRKQENYASKLKMFEQNFIKPVKIHVKQNKPRPS